MATQTVEAVDHKLLAAGEWMETGEWDEVRSPYDGTVVGRVAQGDAALVDRAASAAQAAFESADFPQHERAAVLDRAAELVGERLDDLALTIAAEAGKPLKTARVEAERCVDTLTFSAVEARKLTGGTVPMEASPAGAGKLGVMLRVPYGVVGAISPFNFPLNLVAHKLGPAIAAGNAVVLKPAGQTPISALKLAAILVEAGLPEGWLSVVPGPGSEVGNAIVEHELTAALTFTGSAEVGWGIRSRVPHKKVNLELGSNAPLIVHCRRRLGDGRRQGEAPRLLPRRPELHLDPADPRPRGRRRRLHRAPRRQRRDAAGRRPARPRDRRRAADLPRRPRPGQGVGRRGGRRRRRAADRRRAGRRGPLPGADPARLAAARGQGLVRGDLRPGGDDRPLLGLRARRCGWRTTPSSASRPASSPATSAAAWRRRRTLEFGGVLINEVPTFRADQQPYGGVKDSGNTREGPAFAVIELTEERFVTLQG